jgi:hypothetical protein
MKQIRFAFKGLIFGRVVGGNTRRYSDVSAWVLQTGHQESLFLNNIATNIDSATKQNRHSTATWKVAGSIPVGVNGVLH